MFCTNCGKELNRNLKNCLYCGEKVNMKYGKKENKWIIIGIICALFASLYLIFNKNGKKSDSFTNRI